MGKIRFVVLMESELYDKIMKQCVEEIQHHHPKLRHIRVSRRFMLEQLANYYLGIDE